MKVVGMIYKTAVGQTSNVKITFRLPLSWASVVLLPSGRLDPIQVTVNNAHYTDAAPVLFPFYSRCEGAPTVLIVAGTICEGRDDRCHSR
jgi:hypothetical protein